MTQQRYHTSHYDPAAPDGPPKKDFLGARGGLVKEECTLVGHVDAPPDRRQYLEDLGVDMRWAFYDSDSERWERCLMSEGVADLLEDLHAEGDFPYAFEAGPSLGEAARLLALARGMTARRDLPLSAYVTPAPAGELDKLACAGNGGRPTSRRVRRGG